MTDDMMYVRNDQAIPGRVEMVKCPYEWIPMKKGQFNPSRYLKNCIDAGCSCLCLGLGCAIYPCERVRDFAVGKI